MSHFEFRRNYRVVFLALHNHLTTRETFTSVLKSELIDKGVLAQLPEIFCKQFQPRETTADGNCLWNMISICLIGDEKLSKILRLATLFTLLELEEAFKAKLAWEISSINDQVQVNNLVDEQFNENLTIAKSDKAYGNQYHLLALATF
jgi:hypothetical protein